MKKIFKVLLASSLLSLMISVQANAVNFNPVEDFYVDSQTGSFDNSALMVYNFGANKSIAYLKFDLSTINFNNAMATLNIFGSSVNSMQKPNDLNFSIFRVDDDDWVAKTDPAFSWTGSNPPISYDSNALTSYSNSLTLNTGFSFDLGSILSEDLDDNFLSLAIVSEPPFSFSLFSSNESQYCPGPSLDVTPAPEPSTLLLGLMGIGSLFGISRRKKA